MLRLSASSRKFLFGEKKDLTLRLSSCLYRSPYPLNELTFSYSTFIDRHIGTASESSTKHMLKAVDCDSIPTFIKKVVPQDILATFPKSGSKSNGLEEHELLAEMRKLATENRLFKSYIGMGYYGTHTPTVILRNILEVINL